MNLAGLSPAGEAALSQLNAILAEEARRDIDSLYAYQPLPEQLSFFRSNATYRILRGGNQSSKTLGAAVEVARWARQIQLDPTWSKPAIRRNAKLDILCITVSMDQIGKILYAKLCQPGAYYKYRFECPSCGTRIFAFPNRVQVKLLENEKDGNYDGYAGRIECHGEKDGRPCSFRCWVDQADPAWRWEAPPLIPESAIEEIAWTDKGKNIPHHIRTKYATLLFKAAGSGREHIQGTQSDLVWADEEFGAEAEGVYEELIRGMMARKGRFIWDASPLAKQRHLIDLHDRAESGDEDVCENVLTLTNNFHLPKVSRETVIRNWPPEQRPTRVKGEFLLLEGLVYPEFSRKVHVIEPFDIDNERYAGQFCWYRAIDPGLGTTAVLWFAIDRHGDYVITDELYMKSGNLHSLASEIGEKSRGRNIINTVIDPADQKSLACPEGLRVVLGRDYGIPCHSNFDRNVQQGIFRVKEDLVVSEERGRPRMTVFRTCTEFIREMSRYRLGDEKATTDGSGKPVKVRDHGVDAARYRVMAGMTWYADRTSVGTPDAGPAFRHWQELRRRQRSTAAARML